MIRSVSMLQCRNPLQESISGGRKRGQQIGWQIYKYSLEATEQALCSLG